VPSGFAEIGFRFARIVRVRALIAAMTLVGISCMYTFPVVLMLACRKIRWASFIVPCCCIGTLARCYPLRNHWNTKKIISRLEGRVNAICTLWRKGDGELICKPGLEDEKSLY